MKRRLRSVLLLTALLLGLSGCRVRTTGVNEIPVPPEPTVAEPEKKEEDHPPQESPREEPPQPPQTQPEEPLQLPQAEPEEPPESPQTEPEQSPEPPPVEETPAPVQEPSPQEPPETPPQESEPDPEVPTLENPQAPRREYSQEAPAIEDPGAETPVETPPLPDAPAAPAPAPEGENSGEGAVKLEGETGEQTVTVTVPSEEADQLGEAPEEEEAASMQEYYQTLLDDRLGSQFECQRLYVYWETEEDWVTVVKSSPEHQIILNAGGYSVSAKLLEENLTVDGGWVSRKNPGAIIKWVDSSVLGSGVSTTGNAQALRDAILARPELAETDAVRNGRVLLLSRELRDTEAGRLASAVFAARALYADSFADVNPEEALTLLSQEAGAPLSGIFAYAG